VGPRAGLYSVEKRNICCLCRESNSGPSSPQALAIPSEMSRFKLSFNNVNPKILSEPRTGMFTSMALYSLLKIINPIYVWMRNDACRDVLQILGFAFRWHYFPM
jgi:hypothetical protein